MNRQIPICRAGLEEVGVFDEDTHTLRLKSELFDLQVGYANPRGFWPNGFQELEIVSRFGAISSLNLPDFPEKKPFLRPFPDIPWKFARKMRENNQKHYGSNATE